MQRPSLHKSLGADDTFNLSAELPQPLEFTSTCQGAMKHPLECDAAKMQWETKLEHTD